MEENTKDILISQTVDIEKLVISAIIKYHDWQPIIDKGITEDYFLSGSGKSAFNVIRDYFRNYRGIISKVLFEAKFPDYTLYDNEITDALDLYLDELRKQAIFNIIRDETIKLTGDFRKVAAGKKEVSELVSRVKLLNDKIYLDYTPVREVDIRENADERLQLIEDRQDPAKKEQGIGTPWPQMNEWITGGGWKPGQLVTLVGALASGKSFLACLVALEAWKQGKSVLFFTNEMTLEEIQDRVEAMYSFVPTNLISDGQVLKHLQYKHNYIDAREKISAMPSPFIICEDTSSSGIDLVRSKIQFYNPDIIVIDGAYLWAETKWEESAKFTRALKKIAKEFRKCLIVSWQFNRFGSKKKRSEKTGSADTTDIGYTFSLSQDSDIMISCYLDDTLREANELVLRLLKQRQGIDGKELIISFDHEQMNFAQLRVEENDKATKIANAENNEEDVDF